MTDPNLSELHVDIESFSEADLRKVGVDVYANDPSTEITLCAWRLNTGDTQLWDYSENSEPPVALSKLLVDPNVVKIAHNASFEMTMFECVWGLDIDPAQWRCTMVMAYSLSFPGALGDVAEVLGFPEDSRKIADGKRLISKFCKPRRPSKRNPATRWLPDAAPEDWARFRDYCRQDVHVEHRVYDTLLPWT